MWQCDALLSYPPRCETETRAEAFALILVIPPTAVWTCLGVPKCIDTSPFANLSFLLPVGGRNLPANVFFVIAPSTASDRNCTLVVILQCHVRVLVFFSEAWIAVDVRVPLVHQHLRVPVHLTFHGLPIVAEALQFQALLLLTRVPSYRSVVVVALWQTFPSSYASVSVHPWDRPENLPALDSIKLETVLLRHLPMIPDSAELDRMATSTRVVTWTALVAPPSPSDIEDVPFQRSIQYFLNE
mmetsp:Transcript_28659/g.69433  ORF Transcript_28659/g.69433 Transcript_28659/m.69433 type:complete len:242 (-) Transcript_28659:534-1259(-)